MLDSFFAGSKKNITLLIAKQTLEMVGHGLIHPIFLEMDEIYNIACPAPPIHYQFNPMKTTKNSVTRAINMLGLAETYAWINEQIKKVMR